MSPLNSTRVLIGLMDGHWRANATRILCDCRLVAPLEVRELLREIERGGFDVIILGPSDDDELKEKVLAAIAESDFKGALVVADLRVGVEQYVDDSGVYHASITDSGYVARNLLMEEAKTR